MPRVRAASAVIVTSLVRVVASGARAVAPRWTNPAAQHRCRPTTSTGRLWRLRGDTELHVCLRDLELERGPCRLAGGENLLVVPPTRIDGHNLVVTNKVDAEARTAAELVHADVDGVLRIALEVGSQSSSGSAIFSEYGVSHSERKSRVLVRAVETSNLMSAAPDERSAIWSGVR